jgi:hypothetical protein
MELTSSYETTYLNLFYSSHKYRHFEEKYSFELHDLLFTKLHFLCIVNSK